MTEVEHGRYTVELVLRKADGDDAPAMRWSVSVDVTTAERELVLGAALEEGAWKIHELLFAEGAFGEMQGDPPTDEAWWADESLW